jgi:hypothetical protein
VSETAMASSASHRSVVALVASVMSLLKVPLMNDPETT